MNININNIEQGEKVFDINHGWGIVNNIYVYKFQVKKVSVKFTSGGIFDYDETGRLYVHQFTPTISYHEYKATPVSEYRVGKRVYDINYGWGEITDVSKAKRNKTPIRVRYEEHNVGYSIEGKRFERQFAPSLSNNEYHIVHNSFPLSNLLNSTKNMENPIDETGNTPEPVTPKTYGRPAPEPEKKNEFKERMVETFLALALGILFLTLWFAVFK